MKKNITNDIINKFLSHEQTTENDLIKAINDVFNEERYYNKPAHVQNGEIIAYNIDIAKEVIDNNEFKQTYPNAYEILLSKYNEKNGITDVHSTGEETKGKRILFTARRLGWSRTNRNIVDDLVTTYTSQTTAHHLDAVKMGSVPNVDEFTFSTYKFLSTLGIDFENVIGFMRQPVITNLVANNNLIKSTFVSSSNQAIKMTLADIANKLGLRNGKYSINYNTSNNKVIDAFKANIAFVQQFNTLFGIDISNLDDFGKNIDDYNDYNTGLTEIFNGWLEGQYDDQSIMEYAYDCNDEQLGLFNLIPLIIYLKEKEII